MAWPKGKKRSPETIAKMVAAHTGRGNPRSKPSSIKARGNKLCRKLYPVLPDQCELCESPATDRHHKDQDTFNNAPENIQFLCHPCHLKVDNPRHRGRCSK